MKYIYSLIFIIFLFATSAAQSFRGLINDGVDLYENKKYGDAEVKFKKGLDKDFDTFEGHYDLGNAYYKQGKLQEALEEYKQALNLTDDDLLKSKVFHNIGNALFKAKKLKESIGAYVNSLKLNPEDLETKYNLSYALKQMQQQKQQQKNKQNKNDKNKDKKQRQNQERNQNRKQKQQQQKQQQQQQKKEKISKEEAQRILEALKNNESDLQKKLRKRKGKVKRKEKDW